MTLAFPPKPGTPISPRERQILAGIVRGRSNEQIGEDLGISRFTVKTHVENMSRRYETHSRAGIVGEAYRRGDLTGLRPEPHERIALGAASLAALEGMSRGLTNREIGRLRDRGEETVRSLALRMFRKMRAQNRAHAVALGYQHGYLPLPQQAVGRAA